MNIHLVALALKLGDPGSISVAGQAGMQHMKWSGDTQINAHTRLGASVLLDRFVAPNVSVGVGLGANSSYASMRVDNTDGSTKNWGVNGSLRLGYFIPLGERAALWPVARVGIAGDWGRAYNVTGGQMFPTSHYRTIETALDLQLTYAISDHVYLRAVPGGIRAAFNRGQSSGAREVSAGFNQMMFFGVGGWF